MAGRYKPGLDHPWKRKPYRSATKAKSASTSTARFARKFAEADETGTEGWHSISFERQGRHLATNEY